MIRSLSPSGTGGLVVWNIPTSLSLVQAHEPTERDTDGVADNCRFRHIEPSFPSLVLAYVALGYAQPSCEFRLRQPICDSQFLDQITEHDINPRVLALRHAGMITRLTRITQKRILAA